MEGKGREGGRDGKGGEGRGRRGREGKEGTVHPPQCSLAVGATGPNSMLKSIIKIEGFQLTDKITIKCTCTNISRK